jgi:hypothetical protein
MQNGKIVFAVLPIWILDLYNLVVKSETASRGKM